MPDLHIIKPKEAQKLDNITVEQLAAYLVAIMQADWHRPNCDEMRRILKAAEGQVSAIETIG